MEFLKKLQRIKTVLIVFGIVIGFVGLFLYLDSQRIGTYVQENYLVADSGKSTVGKQAFVYEYTVTTGDTTLADILGVSTQVSINPGLGEQAYAFNEQSDLRGLVKAVASAWVTQGNASSKLQVDDIAATAYQEQQSYSGEPDGLRELLEKNYSFSTAKVYNVYNGDGDRTYAVNTMLGTSSISTCRCCCCLSEGIVQYLVNIEYPTSMVYKGVRLHHVMSVGVNSADKVNYQNEPHQLFKSPNTQVVNGKTRAVGEGLVGLSSSTTINDLIQQNKLGIGTILMWVSDEHVVDGVYNHPSHIAMVVYMDDTHIYTAGAGSSKDIMCDAILGYDGKHERTANIYTEFDDEGSAISNIVFWTDSSIVERK